MPTDAARNSPLPGACAWQAFHTLQSVAGLFPTTPPPTTTRCSFPSRRIVLFIPCMPSFVVLKRLLELEAADKPALRERLRREDQVLLSWVRQLSDAELIQKLSACGIQIDLPILAAGDDCIPAQLPDGSAEAGFQRMKSVAAEIPRHLCRFNVGLRSHSRLADA
jgi:hypothetical protein